VGLLCLLAAGACAGYHPLPYLAGSSLPARGAYGHGLALDTDYDSAADSTTVALLVEKGRHFIRWHRPRVIAGFAYPGTWPQRMDSIFIEFRTQSPQYTETNGSRFAPATASPSRRSRRAPASSSAPSPPITP
jgi:hypothetical protein